MNQLKSLCLLLSGIFFVLQQASAQCEKAYALIKQKDEKIKELNEKDRAIPFVEQFDKVKIGIDVFVETLQTTKKDLAGVKKNIDRLMGETREQNSQFRNVRQWARCVYANPAWEPPTPNQPRKGFLGRMKDAIGKKIGLINDIEGDVSRFAKAMTLLEKGVHARHGSPSEQLIAFKDYFSSINGVLKKYAKGVPVIGIFTKMFDYYEKAIGSIIRSVQVIEKEYAKKDAMLAQLGPEFNNVRYTWPRTSPREEFAKQRKQIKDEIDRLDNELKPYLRDCGSSIKQKNLTFHDELLMAREVAMRNCGPSLNISSEDEALNARNNALFKMNAHYPVPKNNSMNSTREIAWTQEQHSKWKQENIEKPLADVVNLEISLADAEAMLQKLKTGALVLSAVEQERINMHRSKVRIALRDRKSRLAQSQPLAAKRENDLGQLLEAQHILEEFHACVRRNLEDLAKSLKWDPYWVNYIDKKNHSAVARPQPTKEHPGSIIFVNFPSHPRYGKDMDQAPSNHLWVSWSGDLVFPVKLKFYKADTDLKNKFKPLEIIIDKRPQSTTIILEDFCKFADAAIYDEAAALKLKFSVTLEETTTGRRMKPYIIERTFTR